MPNPLWFSFLSCLALCFPLWIFVWDCTLSCLLVAWIYFRLLPCLGLQLPSPPPWLSCMSREEFQELSPKVDQLADQVAILAQAVGQLSLGKEPTSSAASVFSVVPSSPAQEAAASRGGYGSNYDYNRLAGLIPPCGYPDLVHSRGGNLSFVERAKRAWEIGHWDKFCLEGRLDKPRPSTPIPLQNTCCGVLRAEGFETPLLCSKASDYRSVVKDFSGPTTISHAFPSHESIWLTYSAGLINGALNNRDTEGWSRGALRAFLANPSAWCFPHSSRIISSGGLKN